MNEIVPPKILVIGSIFMDLVFHGMPSLGTYGQSISCDSYNYVPGGKGANQAVAASKMGASVSMVGCLGKDENGEILLNNFHSFGIKTRDIIVSEDYNSGLAIMLISNLNGKYVSYHVKGGNAHISPLQVKKALDRENYDMVLMQLEMPLETVYETCRMTRERNIPVFLDAGPACPICLENLEGVTFISPNEIETESLTGISVNTLDGIQEAAAFLFDKTKPKYVLLKLGERGAYLYDGKEGKLIPGFSVKAMDTTAAGDTFGGAFAKAYCCGKSVEDAVVYAHVASALCVSKEGGQTSIPTSQEVELYYSSEERTRI